MMSPLIISLGAGILVGLFYALLRVRSPAPPAIALIGLLGMIIGGQLVQLVKPVQQASTVSSHVDKRS
jgi:XapX domain-containing protein